MHELQRLLATKTSKSDGGPSLVSSLERGVVVVLACGVFAAACAFAVVGFLALAVFFVTLPQYGDVYAACFAALAAAILMGILVLGLRRYLQPEPQPPERASPLTGLAPPKTIWDVVALVVAGAVAGLSQKR